MPAPKTKAELLAAIDTEFQKLDLELESLSAAATRDRTMIGHAKSTTMSPHDLVAYLVGWNELVLKWIARRRAGKAVDFPETGFRWNELGRLAQKFYCDYETIPFSQLVTRLRTAKAKLASIVEKHDDDALYGRPWYERWPLGRMIQFNTASPYANARARLRKWRKLRTSSPTPHEESRPRSPTARATTNRRSKTSKGRRPRQPPSADAK